MNPDYLAGMRAFDAGEPFDPKQRGQWRRGYERARENRLQSAWERFRPLAYRLLSEAPDTTRLEMLAPPAVAYREPEGARSIEAERVAFTVTWDVVSEPHRSQGVRGCIVSCEGVVLGRFDWGK